MISTVSVSVCGDLFINLLVFLFSAAHTLQYFYTGVSPGLNFPEFTVAGLLDGELFVSYDSETKKVIPKTEWIKKNVDKFYWKRQRQKLQNDQKWFRRDVEILSQTRGDHQHTVSQPFH